MQTDDRFYFSAFCSNAANKDIVGVEEVRIIKFLKLFLNENGLQ